MRNRKSTKNNKHINVISLNKIVEPFKLLNRNNPLVNYFVEVSIGKKISKATVEIVFLWTETIKYLFRTY
jgi:hypothetical protein